MAKQHEIRDRIVELRRVPARELVANPKNWRRHPQRQAEALRGVLAEIGYADALIARETPDGLTLIDGHLRAETTPEALVPVLVVDVTEVEADKLLATLDPLAAMAETDAQALAELLETVKAESDAVRDLLDSIAQDAGIQPPPFEPLDEETNQLDRLASVKCPQCGHEFTP